MDSTFWCTMSEMCTAARVSTITTTMAVMATTSFVFRRRAGIAGQLTGSFSRGAGSAVFLKLIVQGLEADAKNFRGPGLVVPGGGQGLENQHLFRLADRGADAQSDAVGIPGRLAAACLTEVRRQMAWLDQRTLADDDRPFQGVPQFAHVAGPVVPHEQLQDTVVNSGHLTVVFGVHVREQRLHQLGRSEEHT